MQLNMVYGEERMGRQFQGKVKLKIKASLHFFKKTAEKQR